MPVHWRNTREEAERPLAFPGKPTDVTTETETEPVRPDLTGLPVSADQLYETIDEFSRRIDDLARELECLGFFDEPGGDAPRAA